MSDDAEVWYDLPDDSPPTQFGEGEPLHTFTDEQLAEHDREVKAEIAKQIRDELVCGCVDEFPGPRGIGRHVECHYAELAALLAEGGTADRRRG